MPNRRGMLVFSVIRRLPERLQRTLHALWIAGDQLKVGTAVLIMALASVWVRQIESMDG